jgi:hypothetical protein
VVLSLALYFQASHRTVLVPIFFKGNNRNHQGRFGVLSKHPCPYYLAKPTPILDFKWYLACHVTLWNPQTSQNATKLRKDAQTCQIKILATSPLYL